MNERGLVRGLKVFGAGLFLTALQARCTPVDTPIPQPTLIPPTATRPAIGTPTPEKPLTLEQRREKLSRVQTLISLVKMFLNDSFREKSEFNDAFFDRILNDDSYLDWFTRYHEKTYKDQSKMIDGWGMMDPKRELSIRYYGNQFDKTGEKIINRVNIRGIVEMSVMPNHDFVVKEVDGYESLKVDSLQLVARSIFKLPDDVRWSYVTSGDIFPPDSPNITPEESNSVIAISGVYITSNGGLYEVGLTTQGAVTLNVTKAAYRVPILGGL